MEPHILVADDDQDSRELLQIFLQSSGFRVSITGSSAEALYLAGRERFDALILDNWMPNLTGLELCRHIRAFDPRTPILFCSGAISGSDIAAGMAGGAQGESASRLT